MKPKNSFIAISFNISVLAILTTIFFSFYGGWVSPICLWLLLFGFSIIFLKSRKESNYTIPLFCIAFSVYSIYMFVTNFIFVKDPSIDFFMMVDSKKFWNFSNYKIYSFSDFWTNYNSILPETIRYPLFSFINLAISFFGQIIDQNNILIQKLQSVWLGAFSVPYIYLSLRKFFDKNKALKYALFFALFTHVCIYSVVFNRDPHVYLLYTIAIYLIINYDTCKNVFWKLTLLFVLVCGFRLEHGLFFMMFIFIYLYLNSTRNKNLKILVVVLVPLAVILISPLLFDKYGENSGAYQGKIDGAERSETSAAAASSKLPPGVKQVVMTVNSQVAPAVPFWRDWYADVTDISFARNPSAGYFTPWRFMESLASIVWIYVWGIIVYSFFIKNYQKIPLELNLLLLIAVLLLIAASTSVNARRTYCVYPAIYIYAIYSYNLLSKRKVRFVFKLTSWLLIFIYIAYFYFKG